MLVPRGLSEEAVAINDGDGSGAQVRARVQELLKKYPGGILAQRYEDGIYIKNALEIRPAEHIKGRWLPMRAGKENEGANASAFKYLTDPAYRQSLSEAGFMKGFLATINAHEGGGAPAWVTRPEAAPAQPNLLQTVNPAEPRPGLLHDNPLK
ncbi:MAG: hypothetical protein HY053_06950 [Proteobacteria bacterium]|nr:hypothetical protein [Pseudomonadota bacterium]